MTVEVVNDISYPIRLGQLLKKVDAAQDGLQAKILIQDGEVSVNGKIETRRGRQLQKDDVVEITGKGRYRLR